MCCDGTTFLMLLGLAGVRDAGSRVGEGGNRKRRMDYPGMDLVRLETAVLEIGGCLRFHLQGYNNWWVLEL